MSRKLLASRTSVYSLAACLFLLGTAMTWYRHQLFEVPFFPDVARSIWSIEAKVEFEGTEAPVKLSLAIPHEQPGFEVVTEHTASPGYGLAFLETAHNRRAEWSIRSAKGKQTLYYQVDMLVKPDTFDQRIGVPPLVGPVTFAGPEAAAAQQLFQRARERSADVFTLTRELIFGFNDESQLARLLEKSRTREQRLVEILRNEGIPARVVDTLFLEDGRRRQVLVPFIQVFDQDHYELFNPKTGQQGQAANQLLWEQSSSALLDLVGGKGSKVSFSIIHQEAAALSVSETKSLSSEGMHDFSIHLLPLEDQALFKIILLIPIGVLMVVFMRVLIGLRTSGTFMPVLIALAFMQTNLIVGILGFAMIVGLGLLIRSYLSRHNLLLVARIGAVILSVIIIIAGCSIIANTLGFTEGLKISFFPMIILSWTIERMSILWEEDGPKEVMIQGGGSLLVAVLAYLVMINPVVRYWMFNFIGLQFVFMAVVLLFGNYTGYRLTELQRFGALFQKEKPKVDITPKVNPK